MSSLAAYQIRAKQQVLFHLGRGELYLTIPSLSVEYFCQPLYELEDSIHSNVLTFVCEALNKLHHALFHTYSNSNLSLHRITTQMITRVDLYKSPKNYPRWFWIIEAFGS